MAQSKIIARSMGALAGFAATAAIATTPASAAELPMVATPSMSFAADPAFAVWNESAETVEHHRYRRYRGYRGWRGYRRHRRVDAGDVVAGVLILGGIAAIASAASNNNKNRRYRDRDYDYRDRDYRDRDYRDRNYREDRRGDSRYSGGKGIDRAVSQCVDRIERDVRVESVDSVERSGVGWRVTGSLYNGDAFTCRIDNDGRIESVDLGGGFAGAYSGGSAGQSDGQWSDDRYAQARASVGVAGPTQTQQQPAYPGGPLPGESFEAVDGDLGG